MPLAVKHGEAANPASVDQFRAQAMMLDTATLAHMIDRSGDDGPLPGLYLLPGLL